MKRRGIKFTKSGFEAIKIELAEFQKKRKQAVDDVTRASAMGDRSENAFYKSARQTLAKIDSRLRYLKRAVDQAVIIEPKTDGTIGIGSQVVLQDSDHTHTYTIVGDYESNLRDGKLSHHSPLGKSLIGKKEGDRSTIAVPAGTRTYTILSVR